MARRARLAITLFAALLTGFLTWHYASRDGHRASIELHRGQPVDRVIGAGDVHHYHAPVEAGQILEIIVEQQGIDLSLSLFDGKGTRLRRIDSPNGEWGQESSVFRAAAAGTYRYQVRASKDTKPGRYEIRMDILDEADTSADQRAEAAELYNRAEALRRDGGREARASALRLYERAAGHLRHTTDYRGLGLVHVRIANLHRISRDSDAALDAKRRALKYYRQAGLRRDTALALNRLGRWYRDVGHHAEALGSLQEARSIFAALGDRAREASMLNSMGRVYRTRGEIQEALRHFGLALSMWRTLGRVLEQGTTLTNIAELYILSGQLEIAESYIQQAIDCRRRARDRKGEAISITTLGRIQRRQGKLASARVNFARSLSLLPAAQNQQRQAIFLLDLGLTDFRLGDFQRARRSYTRSLTIAQQLGDHHTEAVALVNLGWLEDEQGLPTKALEHYQSALRLFHRLRNREGQASAYFGMALAKRHMGHLDDARWCMELALDRVEKQRRGAVDTILRSSYLAFKHNYYEFYIDLLMDLHAQDPDASYGAQAFEASERSRARSLLDSLSPDSNAPGAADAPRAVAPELLARERSLQDTLHAKEHELFALEDRGAAGDELASLQAQLHRLTAELREVRTWVQRSQSSKLDQTPLGLEAIQQLLDQETVLLHYSLTQSRSFVWLIDRHSISIHELPGSERVERLALQAHRLLKNSHRAGLAQQVALVLGDLSQMLLGPVADQLGGRRLVIVPDGALSYLPFAALPRPGAEPLPLITEHEVVHLPSASVLYSLRARAQNRSPAPRALAIVGDPVSSPRDERLASVAKQLPGSGMLTAQRNEESFERLLFAQQEAETILSLLPQDARPRTALGFDANVDLLRSGELKSYRMLHFVAHGRLNSEIPELTSIMLSRFKRSGQLRPGALYAHELHRLDLPAELITLSACETALGREVRGEGLLGLTQGFFQAGATRLVVSLWAVDDRATTKLMSHFYHGLLQDGLTPVAALRKAQLAMLEDPQWRAPYYWAGFSVQGDWTGDFIFPR